MTDQAMSPLRRRMIEDMTIRKFAPKTQHDYLQRVKNFATRQQTRTNVNDLDRETLILLELPGQGPALITVWLQV